MADFLYPRTITVRRPTPVAGAGGLGYGGLLPTEETQVGRSMRAGIQYDRLGRVPQSGLPGDTVGRTLWKIFVPDAKPGAIQARDIIVDDFGIRYQVAADYWTSAGYQLQCERLEA